MNKVFMGREYDWTHELATMINNLPVSHEEKMRLWDEHAGKSESAFVGALHNAKGVADGTRTVNGLKLKSVHLK